MNNNGKSDRMSVDFSPAASVQTVVTGHLFHFVSVQVRPRCHSAALRVYSVGLSTRTLCDFKTESKKYAARGLTTLSRIDSTPPALDDKSLLKDGQISLARKVLYQP
jgi:hypothetical protein